MQPLQHQYYRRFVSNCPSPAMWQTSRSSLGRLWLHMHICKAAGVRRLTSGPRKDLVIFSGIQPTGVPHIGNYLGALQHWVDLQQTAQPSSRLLFSIVDLHALTSLNDGLALRTWKRETLATLLAIGLDPQRCIIFYQSQVPAHAELFWILSCTASVGYLSRMTQWKVSVA